MNNLLSRQRLPAEPRIIALGGGAGGTGRSTFACDLARLMVRRGRRVLLVDADVANPNLHVRLGVDPRAHIADRVLRDETALDSVIVPGGRNRPALLPLGLLLPRPFARPEWSASRLVAGLRAQRYDEIIVDLPATADPLWTTVFVLSDVPVLVAPTEAISLHGATRYARAALVYALLAHPDARDAEYELLRAVESLPIDADAETIRRTMAGDAATRLLDDTLSRLELYLVLAQTREPAERDLGHAFALALSYQLDVWPRYLGSLEHDERRWFHQRHEQRAAMGSDAAAETSCDGILQSLSDLAAFDAANPRAPRAKAVAPSDRLGVSVELDPVAMRQAYRRLWEGFRRESPLTASVLPRGIREKIIRELEDANRELQSAMAESAAVPRTVVERPRAAANPGERLRNARTSAGLSQRELSLQTKIGLRVLESIERFEVDDLPRPVYLRGYLREMSNALGLDPDSVMDEYLTAVSEARNARILTRSPS